MKQCQGCTGVAGIGSGLLHVRYLLAPLLPWVTSQLLQYLLNINGAASGLQLVCVPGNLGWVCLHICVAEVFSRTECPGHAGMVMQVPVSTRRVPCCPPKFQLLLQAAAHPCRFECTPTFPRFTPISLSHCWHS